MKLVLKKINLLSGPEASFYTVIVDGQNHLFATFINENLKDFEEEIATMIGRIKNMANINGATPNFFKPDESKKRHDVEAFFDLPDKRLRLYCVRLSETLVVIGGGGPKPKWMIRWQESRKLTKEVEFMETISELIEINQKNGQLSVTKDGLSFTGDLKLA